MNVGIIGDYNSVMTGMGAMKGIWDNRLRDGGDDTEGNPIGWEGWLANKIEHVNFEVTPCGSNQEIINQLAISIQRKPKDLYIVQTTSWYMSSFGIIDHDYYQYSPKHNLTYNLPDPRSYLSLIHI